MILYEFLLKEIRYDKNSELEYLEEYLILSESITIKEAKELILLVEQMHQDVEKQMEKKIKKALTNLTIKYNKLIKKAREDVLKVRQQSGSSGSIVKNKLIQIDNLKQEFSMKKNDLINQYKKIIKNLKDKVNRNKKIIRLKALNTKYPKGKYAIGATLAGVTGYAGYKFYRNYMSKAARECAGKQGLDKENCIKKYKELAKKELK